MPKWTFDSETDEFKCDALYFIQEGKDGPIKIGRGVPRSRLQTLQIGNPRRLHLIGDVENGGYSEAFWHSAFRALILRGEWFRPDACLVDAIGCVLQGKDWAHHCPAPIDCDPDHYGDCMLDAFDWYQDLVWRRVAEKEAASRAVSYALQMVEEYEPLPLPAGVGRVG